MGHEYRPFPYHAPPGLSAPEPRHPVVIVGAGPIGLALACELRLHGVPVTVLDDNNVVSVGSRAICWSKRSLEILDRLGVGQACVDKGVVWQVGRTYHRDAQVWAFDLAPEDGYKRPAFVNLQQYHVEEFLVARAMELGVDLRWKNKVTGLGQADDHARLRVETPEGSYALQADWVIACDGAKSPLRGMMGLDFAGELFEERFLIADIRMEADFPAERRFWFEPTFHPGQSALLHKQPDNIYRIDLQLGWDADPVAENTPERIIPRIERVVGHRDFTLDWTSVYSFQCRRLERFVQGRVIFCGDSAHVVSPFGARGGNGGLQDVDALGWRLAMVVRGEAPASALGAYGRERQHGADENIAHSARATRFMSPGDGVERTFRDAVLALAARAEFARPMVNSGRLSRPCTYPLEAPDDPNLPPAARPGAVAPDAPQGDDWLLDALGRGYVLVAFGEAPEIEGLPVLRPVINQPVIRRWLGGEVTALYLVRPDQVVAARWTRATADQVSAAWQASREGTC